MHSQRHQHRKVGRGGGGRGRCGQVLNHHAIGCLLQEMESKFDICAPQHARGLPLHSQGLCSQRLHLTGKLGTSCPILRPQCSTGSLPVGHVSPLPPDVLCVTNARLLQAKREVIARSVAALSQQEVAAEGQDFLQRVAQIFAEVGRQVILRKTPRRTKECLRNHGKAVPRGFEGMYALS